MILFLKTIWKKLNLPCSKRLKAAIPLWLPYYEKHYGKITEKTKRLLNSISDRTIDRILSKFRNRFRKKGLCTTKPGSILKKRIKVKTIQWNERIPGYLECDTVAHCGGSVGGIFVYTLDIVDIATQWTIQRALLGKRDIGVLNAFKNVLLTLPFKILGIDTDNGSEFINYALYYFFTKRKMPIQFTRSREYQKNDNAHVESKNWSIVRQHLGYQRFENPKIVDLLNDLYSNEFYYYHNFFVPCFKMDSKIRDGAKIIKTYKTPITPYQRIIESEHITNYKKKQLERIFRQLDPIDLQFNIQIKINHILELAQPFQNK